MAGCVACAFFGWVDSPEADIQPWYGDTTDEFWRACGFAKRPAYSTIQRRFVELEEIATVFAETLHRLVQHARKREPRIGQAIVVDGTMVESNARPHRLASLTDPIRGLGKLPVLASQRMPTTGVDDIRRAVNAAALDSGSMRVGEWIDVTERVSRGALGNYRVLVTSNGVPYASLDPDAGFKVYSDASGQVIKWWHGYLILQAADHFTGLPLEAHGFAADEQEFHHYAPAVKKAVATTGHVPSLVTADKGHSTWANFEWSCEHGITLVAPYRPANGSASKRAEATVDFDEHALPFCRHCQSGTDQVGFVLLPAESENALCRGRSSVCVAPRPRNQAVSRCRNGTATKIPPAYCRCGEPIPPTSRRGQCTTTTSAPTRKRETGANAKPRHFERGSRAGQPDADDHAGECRRDHRLAPGQHHQRLAGHARDEPRTRGRRTPTAAPAPTEAHRLHRTAHAQEAASPRTRRRRSCPPRNRGAPTRRATS